MTLTELVLLVAVLIIVAYEVWTAVNHRPRDTISETVWRWLRDYPRVSFLAGLAIGLLCGHLFL